MKYKSRWIILSLAVITLFNLFFQYSVYQKTLNLFWSTSDDKEYLHSTINSMIFVFQGFSIFASLIAILIGSLVISFIGFLLDIKKTRKDYLFVYTLTSLFVSFKVVLTGAINLSGLTTDTNDIVILGNQSVLSQVLDPFLWLGVVLFFLLGIKTLSSSKNKVFILTLVYLSLKSINILSSYFLHYIV
ncbi:hypothetical protein JCM21714_1417 [Gracilibacillus boraciitolerans JCM 21714]|uniref:Yip1 domain-containing protein n=1 Tax=Gracilibacillus boraciitolerans JCM 21714 TaxID=1298598 RepID=W4VI55_9BACI|nr:hypothetical protein [Gracilibacillus boraciitolerans]GAE92419.1 hypothetical protein JCM21714_1417 [Gracilibacillus boraciitolerans JCM 21714]